MDSMDDINQRGKQPKLGLGRLERYYGPYNFEENDPEIRGWKDKSSDSNNYYTRRQNYKYLSEDEDFEVQDIVNRSFSSRTPPIHSEEDNALMKYVGAGVSLASLITENLLNHPFVVLRRQCQVNNVSRRYHLIPVTLVPVIIQIHRSQGLTTLWKGIGSVLLVRGMTLGVEDLISKLTLWPKDIDWEEVTCKSFFKHILLKCCSTAVITPFYSASLVETVQSEIASEKPGFFDVFREGVLRMFTWGSGFKGRMLPIWILILPTVILTVSRYLAHIGLKRGASRFLTLFSERKFKYTGVRPKESLTMHTRRLELETEMNASFIALVVADTIFYPLETVVHRIHLQGTRTIIDNLENGKTVLAILTNYGGSIDCYEKCIEMETPAGLYKGYGALILQYTAHIALIKFTHFVFMQVADIIRKTRNSKGKQV
ncbi:solute carrier family 25 member 46 [Agrilus planipennis]|uniref:Solute carrier family 25 member 46 n=1 Tax=Agrilus planipennis TaxID=224129 RepID=A0A1W4WQ62_AGRPL|nr:solute carrier family 25 member 46 [Agrilus planipennis]